MTFYIGVDLHPYQQTLCWCDDETGETGETGNLKLAHDIEKVREFYSSIDKPAEIDGRNLKVKEKIGVIYEVTAKVERTCS